LPNRRQVPGYANRPVRSANSRATELLSAAGAVRPGRYGTWSLVAAAAMLAIVFVLRIAIDNPHEGVNALYAIPILLMALEWGVLGGLVTAAVTVGLIGVSNSMDDVEVSVLGYLTRATGFVFVGVVVGIVTGRLRGALEKSRDSEERLRAVVEHSSDAVMSSDEEGRIVGWNPAATRTFGWRAEEVLGRQLADVTIPEPIRDPYWDGLRRFLDHGDRSMIGQRFEARGLHRDGHEFPIEITISAVQEHDGWVFHAFMHDISERKGAEAARRSLAAIVESSGDAIFSYTLDGRILTWNDAAERILGYPEHEAIGMRIDELAPADRPDQLSAVLERVRRGERVAPLRAACSDRAGRVVDVAVSASPITDDAGELVAAASIAHDISAQLRSEARGEAARQALGVLATAGSTHRVGAAILPIVGRAGGWTCGAYWEREVDGATLRCDGVWTDPEVGMPGQVVERGATWVADGGSALHVWHVGDPTATSLPCREEAAMRGIRTEFWIPVVVDDHLLGAFQLLDRRERRRDEDFATMMTAIASLFGNFLGRHQAEEEADRAKEEFFGLVSHELRTPLTSIVGYADLLQETESEQLSEQGRGFLEVIGRNARRQLRLVGDLLALVRLLAGTFEIHPRVAELREIVEESVEAARPAAADRGVELSLVAAAIPPCEGDADRLGQVVDNLLSNAIKFTPEGGRVAVRLSRREDSARVEVTDSGVGIPPAEQERLFERLFRATTATERKLPGIGLGLTIAQAIIDAHGGSISVESEEGVGSTFRVELPLRPPPGAKAFTAAVATEADARGANQRAGS
jgi:PAS domain S-box-containing protein